MRIKLPGSMRTKVILLIILIVISIGIIINEGINNRNKAKVLQQSQLQYLNPVIDDK